MDPGARVLLVDCDVRAMAEVRRLLFANDYDVEFACDSCRQALEFARRREPDVLVAGYVLQDMSGFELIREFRAIRDFDSMPALAMVLPLDLQGVQEEATGAGAFAVMPMPVQPGHVLEVVRYATPFHRLLPGYARKEKLEKIFSQLSLNPAHKGYEYLMTAVNIACRSRRFYHAVTRLVYPETARQHGVTAAQVERCIRHTIDVAWTRGDLERQYAYFGNTIDGNKGKPTNGEFIARVSEALRLEAW